VVPAPLRHDRRMAALGHRILRHLTTIQSGARRQGDLASVARQPHPMSNQTAEGGHAADPVTLAQQPGCFARPCAQAGRTSPSISRTERRVTLECINQRSAWEGSAPAEPLSAKDVVGLSGSAGASSSDYFPPSRAISKILYGVAERPRCRHQTSPATTPPNTRSTSGQKPAKSTATPQAAATSGTLYRRGLDRQSTTAACPPLVGITPRWGRPATKSPGSSMIPILTMPESSAAGLSTVGVLEFRRQPSLPVLWGESSLIEA
jgi:hypothetical protein